MPFKTGFGNLLEQQATVCDPATSSDYSFHSPLTHPLQGPIDNPLTTPPQPGHYSHPQHPFPQCPRCLLPPQPCATYLPIPLWQCEGQNSVATGKQCLMLQGWRRSTEDCRGLQRGAAEEVSGMAQSREDGMCLANLYVAGSSHFMGWIWLTDHRLATLALNDKQEQKSYFLKRSRNWESELLGSTPSSVTVTDSCKHNLVT